jgi:hypothetical protein
MIVRKTKNFIALGIEMLTVLSEDIKKNTELRKPDGSPIYLVDFLYEDLCF